MKYNSYVFPIPPEAHADSTMFTKSGRAYTPKKKKEYQQKLLDSCKCLREDFPIPIRTPVVAVWTFIILRGSSIHRGLAVKPTRPDTDGYLKTTKDAIQCGVLSKKSRKSKEGLGIVQDDALIFCELTQKIYTSNPNKQCTSLILWTNPDISTKTFRWKVSPKNQLLQLLEIAGCLDSQEE